MNRLRREDGIALVVAMMALLLMTALGAALVLTTATETAIAGNFQDIVEGLYAADAGVERAVDDLRLVGDWSPLLGGMGMSTFVDGAPGGSRRRPDGSAIDLTQVVSLASCNKITACTAAEMDAVTADRPWGANNPRWRLYAYGRLDGMLAAGAVNSRFYVVAMIADDPSDNDGDPLTDGGTPCGEGEAAAGPPSCNPGSGLLLVRAEAFGPRGSHYVVEATVDRTDPPPGIRIVSWREVR